MAGDLEERVPRVRRHPFPQSYFYSDYGDFWSFFERLPFFVLLTGSPERLTGSVFTQITEIFTMVITGDTDTPRPVKVVQAPFILWKGSPP